MEKSCEVVCIAKQGGGGISQEMLAIQPQKIGELIEWSHRTGKHYGNSFYVVVSRGRNLVLEE